MNRRLAGALALALACTQSPAWGHIIFIQHLFSKVLFKDAHHNSKGTSYHTSYTTTYTTTSTGCIVNCGPHDALPDVESRCVGPDAKLGGIIVLPDRRIMRVQAYLDNASAHCHKAEYPLYASLVRDTAPQQTMASNAKIDVPDSWQERPLSDLQKAGGTMLYMVDEQTHSGVTVATRPRNDVSDADTFAASRVTSQLKKMTDASATPLTKLEVNGMPAWRYEITGRSKTGIALTFITTMYLGDEEIIVTSVWTRADQFQAERPVLASIADSLSGVKDEDIPKDAVVVPLPAQLGPTIEEN
jgi:hypothetical protein